jgi:Dolichyl-phosphate-mannose-protein mannosyltransferase
MDRLSALIPSGLERIRALASRTSLDRGAWLLLGIVLIAALPRVWYLMSAGFRGDEAVYAGQAGILSGDDELRRYFVLTSRGNSNFLLYQQFVALVYFAFGVSDIAARLVSVAFSVGTVVVTFELARTLYTKRIAYIAALAIALSGYAVLLGRLALLDSTLTFFFTLSLLAFAKWVTGGRRSWLFCFAAAASLTAQAKVTGILVLMIALLYLLFSRELWRLHRRDLILSALVFIAFLTPAAVQVLSNTHEFFAFLSDSSARVTHVPWHYYIDKLGYFSGYPILAVWALGIAVALRIRNTGDRLLLAWVLVLGLFFQAYPLKAFNYLLPLIPPLSILGGRGLYSAAVALGRLRDGGRATGAALNGHGRPSLVAALVATGALAAVSIGPVTDVAQTDSYFGLREAAKWLRANTDRNAGVMTISKGSAQYALSFYAQRDAYPYGRFRLATVLPGGKVRSPRPAADGSPSRDWVSYWPPRLIKSGKVSYLVYYTDEGDDPPEAPIVESEQQRSFRNFIEAYGGQLVHTVRRQHEGRAWIYKVTKLLPYPTISFARHRGRVIVRGQGFRFNSRVTVYYHRVREGVFRAGADGSFSGRFPYPAAVQPKYYIVAVDSAGDVASRTGLTLSGHAPVAIPAPNVPATGPASGGFRSNGHPRRLAVKLHAPAQVPVGSSLPVVVHVNNSLAADAPAPQAHVVLSIRTRSGTRVITKRLKQKTTNTLGNAYFNLTSLELPAYYTMSAYVQKSGRRGAAHMTVQVKRR